MESIESLNLALDLFKGTLIFVSHDRQFVSSSPPHPRITPEGVEFYMGDYDEYLHSKVWNKETRHERSRRHRAGAIGRVFAGGILRTGHTVVPVNRGDDLFTLRTCTPSPNWCWWRSPRTISTPCWPPCRRLADACRVDPE